MSLLSVSTPFFFLIFWVNFAANARTLFLELSRQQLKICRSVCNFGIKLSLNFNGFRRIGNFYSLGTQNLISVGVFIGKARRLLSAYTYRYKKYLKKLLSYKSSHLMNNFPFNSCFYVIGYYYYHYFVRFLLIRCILWEFNKFKPYIHMYKCERSVVSQAPTSKLNARFFFKQLYTATKKISI